MGETKPHIYAAMQPGHRPPHDLPSKLNCFWLIWRSPLLGCWNSAPTETPSRAIRSTSGPRMRVREGGRCRGGAGSRGPNGPRNDAGKGQGCSLISSGYDSVPWTGAAALSGS